MARVESAASPPRRIYEEPKPEDELTRSQLYLFTLMHYATRGMDYINAFCDVAPWPFVLFVVLLFVVFCHVPNPGAATVVVAALLWWFIVMTEGRRTLRGIAAAALIAEICRLLESMSFLPNPFKL